MIFLHAVEKAYQARWREGLTAGDIPVPVLRAGLPPNPEPEPLQAGTTAGIFAEFLSDMQAAEAALAALPADAAITACAAVTAIINAMAGAVTAITAITTGRTIGKCPEKNGN